MVCNGLYVHNVVNIDYNRDALLRKAESPIEGTFVDMITIISFILNIIAITAVIIFIIYIAKVHNRIYDIIDDMDRTITNINAYINTIIQNDDSLKEIHNKLNICTNGITELMSKQRRYRTIDDKNANNVINTIKEYLTKIEAKISSEKSDLNKTSSFKKKDNTKLKTASTTNSIRNKKHIDK